MFGFERMLMADKDKLVMGRMKVGSGRWRLENHTALGKALAAAVAVAAAAEAVAEAAVAVDTAAAPPAAPKALLAAATAGENPGIKCASDARPLRATKVPIKRGI